MCGRTACTLAPDDVIGACTYKDKRGKRRQPQWRDPPGGQKYWTSYNVAPTAHTPILVSGKHFDDIHHESERVVIPMKWGLTPSWHQGDPYKVAYETNNCRSEGMLEKRTYKVPLQKGQRCVVLADGYFEWKTTKEGKQPFFFYLPQPDGIQYPASPFKTEKSEPKSEMKEESKFSPETLFDKNVKKEISFADNVKQENPKNNTTQPKFDDDKIKVEIKQERSSQELTKQQEDDWQSTNSKSLKGESNEIKTEETKSFWDTLTSDSKENELHEKKELKRKGEEISSKPAGLCSKSMEMEADGIAEEEDVPVWTGQRLLTMAGVFDVWKPPDGSPPLYSYSIITVPASSQVDWCHHRMPAILSTEEEVEDWLDFANIPLQKASSLIKPQKCLTFHPVSKAVNSSRFKSSDCVKPIDLDKPKVNPSSNFMMNWLKSGSPAKKKKM